MAFAGLNNQSAFLTKFKSVFQVLPSCQEIIFQSQEENISRTSVGAIEAAVKAIEDGRMSQRAVTAEFKIPRGTLQNRLSGLLDLCLTTHRPS